MRVQPWQPSAVWLRGEISPPATDYELLHDAWQSILNTHIQYKYITRIVDSWLHSLLSTFVSMLAPTTQIVYFNCFQGPLQMSWYYTVVISVSILETGQKCWMWEWALQLVQALGEISHFLQGAASEPHQVIRQWPERLSDRILSLVAQKY